MTTTALARALEAIDRRRRIESNASQSRAIADSHARLCVETLNAGQTELAGVHAELSAQYRQRADDELAQLDPENSGAQP